MLSFLCPVQFSDESCKKVEKGDECKRRVEKVNSAKVFKDCESENLIIICMLLICRTILLLIN